MSDEIQNDDPLEGDRGIPSVSKDRDGSGPGFGVVMTIFAIVGALVLWMFWPEKRRRTRSVTTGTSRGRI